MVLRLVHGSEFAGRSPSLEPTTTSPRQIHVMKDKLKSIRVAGIMTALFASVALAADPLTEAATAKAAAGKEARDQVTAANNAAKEANSQRAAGARAPRSGSTSYQDLESLNRPAPTRPMVRSSTAPPVTPGDGDSAH